MLQYKVIESSLSYPMKIAIDLIVTFDKQISSTDRYVSEYYVHSQSTDSKILVISTVPTNYQLLHLIL